MAFYAWTATDAVGKTQRGTLQAEGPKQVRHAARAEADAAHHHRNP